jgi:cyclopropane fatty-acyl-phospholipid synthase-like methyltransferase
MTPDEERAYWDAVALDPERVRAEVYSDLDIDECLEAILLGLPVASARWIMDLGCGPGRILLTLAEWNPGTSFLGVDSSPDMIASIAAANVIVMSNDGRTLTPWHGVFDAIYSMTMFQHIPHKAQRGYIAEVFRILRPGGVFRLQWVLEGEKGPMSYPVRYQTMSRWMREAGFSIVASQRGLVRPQWQWVTAMKP